MNRFFEYLAIFLLCLSAIVIIALHIYLLGWGLLFVGSCLLLLCRNEFRRYFFLLYVSLVILGITPISTNLSYSHIAIMGTASTIALFLPYVVSRFIYKDYLVRFQFHHGRGWYKSEIFYIFFTVIVAYLLLPFMLRNTGAYRNWTILPDTLNLIVLFLGTQFLGLWDELFFISTTLGILRQFFPFKIANIFQAVMMTSFLYALGFKRWCFIFLFIFSLVQGYISKKTESLLYIITIHLTLDLVLYLVLLHLHFPNWIPIFVT